MISQEKGVIIFDDFCEGKDGFSFKLIPNQKKVVYSEYIIKFLQKVKETVAQGGNRLSLSVYYPRTDFEILVCSHILHLKSLGTYLDREYDVPKELTLEVVDSVFSYNTIVDAIKNISVFSSELKENPDIGKEVYPCDLCQEEDNETAHLDLSSGIIYVEGKKVVEGCKCCPKCGRRVQLK